MVIRQLEPAVLFDSNIYLIEGSEKTALIDTGTGFGADATIDFLKKCIGKKTLDYVIVTHRHFDHVGGLGRIIEEFSPEVFASEEDGTPLREGDSESTLGTKFGGKINPMDITFFEDKLDLGGHVLSPIGTPGHTVGSICVLDEVTKSLFSGDTLFVGGVGNTEHPTGSFQQLIDSLKKLAKYDFRALYPGHGPFVENDGRTQLEKALKMVGA